MLNDLYQTLDPIAFSIGPFSARWYGIAYALGFLMAAVVIYFVGKRWKMRFDFENICVVIICAMVGVIIGLVSKKIDLSSGRFGKKELLTFVLTTLVAMAISWIVVAPVLDIVIYAEPAKKVFAQGLVAGASNFVTTAVIGSLLMLAYTKTIAKSGSLKQE